MNLSELKRLIGAGEGPTLEFKRSTGEVRETLHTACAFLNANGGTIVVGVAPDGRMAGQQVSDQTLRDIAQAMDDFEPPIRFEPERIRLASGREVLVSQVQGASDGIPYTFGGRAYERVSNTTRQMPQERYEQLLLERVHSRRRWENQEAEGIRLRDLDREEILRVVEAARRAGRLVEAVTGNVGGILDRLGLRREGRILRAAVVLFGKRFLPDFPQCELRAARFRGTLKEEFLDQRHLKASAFRLLEEAILFCQRHLSLAGRVAPGRLEREDRLLIPLGALREIVVNALVHRDYTVPGGPVSLAIFDDRVEIGSTGALPRGIRPEDLSRDHSSIPRNPLIADVFYRAGLIEKWGRGTNRVIAQCQEQGMAAPEFQEAAASVLVTFRAPVGVTMQVTTQVTVQVTKQVQAILKAAGQPASREQLQRAAGMANREHFRKAYLKPLL